MILAVTQWGWLSLLGLVLFVYGIVLIARGSVLAGILLIVAAIILSGGFLLI